MFWRFVMENPESTTTKEGIIYSGQNMILIPLLGLMVQIFDYMEMAIFF